MAMRRSLAWNSLGQGSFVVLGFVGSIVIARILGPFDTGIFAIAMAVVGLISVFQAIGLANFLVREHELTPDIVATASTVNLAISAFMALCIAGLGFAGEALFKEAGVRDVLLVIAVVPLIGQFAFVPQAMMEREGNFKTLAMIKTGSTLLGLVITIGLALAGYRYMSLAWSQLLTAIVTNAAIAVIARRHMTLRLSLAHWSAISKFGAQIFAISGLTRIASRTMEIVLGRTLGLAALGLYSRASSNHNMLWDSVHGAVGTVIFVDFARLKREGLPMADRYLQILSMMTGLMWPMLGGVAVLAGPLVWTVYGPAWIGAAVPLAMLCLASIALVSTTMTWELFVVSHETGRQVKLEFIRTLFGTSLFIAACFHSLAAAAAARVAEAVFAQFLYRPHLERMTGAPAAGFFRVYLKSGIAAAAAVGPSFALMSAWGFSPQVPVTQAAAAVAAGIALWLVALRLLRHPLHDELASLLKRFSRTKVPA